MKLYRGVVEDNNNPDKNGRVRVRIFGIHTKNNEYTPNEDFNYIKTSDLPWAEVMVGADFGLISGVGISSVLRQGTWVWVTLDHDDPNYPIVIGVIPGTVSKSSKFQYKSGEGFCDPIGEYPFVKRSSELDFNRLARTDDLDTASYDKAMAHGLNTTAHHIINSNIDTVSQTDGFTGANVSQTEPNSLDDKTIYPDSTVLETHSGHVITLDDSDGNERVRVYHRKGSYIEIRPDGSIVQKQATSGVTNHYIHVSDVQEHIAKGVKRYIEENLEEIIGGNFLQNVKGDLKIHVEGNVDWQVDGNITITSSGAQTNTNGGNYTHTAPNIFLN